MDGLKMYDKVRIKKDGATAFIVWFDEDDETKDSYMLEIEGADEMPRFYKREDFEIIGD